MRFSHLKAAAVLLSSLPALAQQAAPAADPAPAAEPEEPAGPDAEAIAALEQAGISRRQFNAALVQTAYSGDAITMQTLLDAGADVNARDYQTRGTALHAAAHEGHEACLQVLIGHGANVHAVNRDGETALFVAAKAGHTECVLALVAAGSDARWKDDDGKSPLLWVARKGDTECVKALVAAGAIHDLLTAAIIGDVSILHHYLSQKINVNQKDDEGNITMIRTDTVKQNYLVSQVVLQCNEKLSELEDLGVKVPVGYLTNNIMFYNMGPKITVKMQQVGNIVTSYESIFESAGINQTRHKIYLNLNFSHIFLV